MKKKLLLAIIEKAPLNSIFEVNYWRKELEDYIPTLNEAPYNIQIYFIGREKLISVIKRHPIEELITHFELICNGNILVKSFDYMEGVILSSTFNYFNPLDYPSIDIAVAEKTL